MYLPPYVNYSLLYLNLHVFQVSVVQKCTGLLIFMWRHLAHEYIEQMPRQRLWLMRAGNIVSLLFTFIMCHLCVDIFRDEFPNFIIRNRIWLDKISFRLKSCLLLCTKLLGNPALPIGTQSYSRCLPALGHKLRL